MSYLLFMDESGHDHNNLPYEVRGGVSIASVNVFNFLTDMQKSEEKIFGCKLSEYKTEFKGSKLLEKYRFEWAKQSAPLSDEERHRRVRRFLSAPLEKKNPTKEDRIAYGQASLMMVEAILNLMRKYEMKIFACAISKEVKKPKSYAHPHFLRKDHIMLMDSFFSFLSEKHEDGIMIMDQCEKTFDNKFKQQLENYFLRTETGKQQARLILPEPLFIESHTNYLIQVADLCIYAINAGFRKIQGMTAETRTSVKKLLEDKIFNLQYIQKELLTIKGKKVSTFKYSIRFHKNPYGIKEKR